MKKHNFRNSVKLRKMVVPVGVTPSFRCADCEETFYRESFPRMSDETWMEIVRGGVCVPCWMGNHGDGTMTNPDQEM
jgi:hypothetical protein